MFENFDWVSLFLDDFYYGRMDLPGYGVKPPVGRLVASAGGDALYFQFRISGTSSVAIGKSNRQDAKTQSRNGQRNQP